MTTISVVCANLFTQTTLSELPKLPDRATRRALARVIYRQGRRPGLVDPQPASDPKPASEHSKKSRALGSPPRPMRHVYKFQEPKRPKAGTLRARLRMDMVPTMFKYDAGKDPVLRKKSGHPQRLFKAAGRI